MRANQLLFHGHAFPGVSATQKNGMVELAVSARNKGRFWAADKPRGFWRSYAEVDPGSTAQVTEIITRYGDPDDIMSRPQGRGASRAGDTSQWPRHIKMFARAAQAWDPPGDDGISRMTGDKDRLEAARWFSDPGERPAAYLSHRMVRPGDIMPAIKELYVSRNPDGDLVLRPFTLLSYMTFSAVLMVQAETPMARCARCSHWYGVTNVPHEVLFRSL